MQLQTASYWLAEKSDFRFIPQMRKLDTFMKSSETRHIDNMDEKSLPLLSAIMPLYFPLLSQYIIGKVGVKM